MQFMFYTNSRTYYGQISKFATMMCENIFIFAYTVVLSSLPLTMSEKYQYYIFENFEMTKYCFIKEQGMNKALQINLRNLHHKMDELTHRLYSKQEPSSAIGSNERDIHSHNFPERLKFAFRSIYNNSKLRKLSVWIYFHSLYCSTYLRYR